MTINRLLVTFLTAVLLITACTPTTQPGPTQNEQPTETMETAVPPTNPPDEMATQAATPTGSDTDVARPTPTNEAAFSLTHLDGSDWILVSYGPTENQITPVAEATAEFDNGNELHGTTGCNNYFTRYTLSGETITLEGIQLTRRACSAEVQPQETAFVDALNSAKSIHLEGSTLIIAYNGGELRFTSKPPAPATSLDGTTWQLAFFQEGNFSYSPIGEITAEFSNDQVTGNASCNSYGADFTVDGSSLTIGEITHTEQACLGEGIMAQEETYLAALGAAQSFVIEGDLLTVTHEKGTLVFSRTS